MAKGEHKKANRPKQEGYEIVLDSGNDTVKKTWVRFGTLDPRSINISESISMWASAIDMGPVEIKPGERKTIAPVDDDQLPALADLAADP
ncbi:MAG: hypothetical protein ND866_19815 [Pyrinomonadaceae bacterium]|nr:hypothetical protein [Pyrinomonadaceae bacterium]